MGHITYVKIVLPFSGFETFSLISLKLKWFFTDNFHLQNELLTSAKINENQISMIHEKKLFRPVLWIESQYFKFTFINLAEAFIQSVSYKGIEWLQKIIAQEPYSMDYFLWYFFVVL